MAGKGSGRRKRSPDISRGDFNKSWDKTLKRKRLPECSVCGKMHKPLCKEPLLLTGAVAIDYGHYDKVLRALMANIYDARTAR